MKTLINYKLLVHLPDTHATLVEIPHPEPSHTMYHCYKYDLIKTSDLTQFQNFPSVMHASSTRNLSSLPRFPTRCFLSVGFLVSSLPKHFF